MQYEKPESLKACAARLIQLGYHPVPIPHGEKGPTIKGWDKLRIAEDQIGSYWQAEGMLIGVLHVNTAMLDVDVYDKPLADKIIAEAFRRFPKALERIGQAPKSGIIMRVEGPEWAVRATRKYQKDGIQAQVDIRAFTRQFVGYGYHPATGKPYTWPRGELWATPNADLPVLTQEEAQSFRDWCEAEILSWAGEDPRKVVDLEERRNADLGDEKCGEAMFLEALSWVSPSLGHEDGWLGGLMAIHDFYNGSTQGLEVAKDWSSRDERYTPREVEAKWKSFKVGGGVTYRAVLGMAKSSGADLREMRRRLEPRPHTDDDWKTFSGAATAEKIEETVAAPPEELFQTWQVIDPFDLPARDFVYDKHYIRKFASLTVAPGGLGKSSLVLAECIAIATGRPILGVKPKKRERVVYYNAEDPLDEIQRRVLAILYCHQIEQSELVGWLFTASGRDKELILSTGEDGTIVEPVFEHIEKFNSACGVAVFAFDPLANMTESPETNDVFRKLGKRLSRMADKLNCSIEIVHHTRKLNGKEAEVEDSRGGGALVGAVRAARALNPMTADEAAKAGLETHIDHFRIEAAGKNNLSRPAAHATWLHRVSIELPNGDSVAAVAPWAWPDAFDGVTADDARRVQIAVAALEADPPRENPQATNWVGNVVARTLNMNTDDKADKARILSMVKTWIKTGILAVETIRDTRNGRDAKVVLAGPNNPSVEARA
jgi:hypothetical protein